MHPSDYAEKLLKEGNKVICFFSSLKTEDFAVKIYADGEIWRVKDILAHFVSSDQNFLRLFKDILIKGKGVSDKFPIDDFTNHQIRLLASLKPTELIDQFKEARSDISMWVEQLSENDLDTGGWHPGMGKSRLGDMIKMVYLHNKIHLRDIIRTLDQ